MGDDAVRIFAVPSASKNCSGLVSPLAISGAALTREEVAAATVMKYTNNIFICCQPRKQAGGLRTALPQSRTLHWLDPQLGEELAIMVELGIFRR